METTALLFILSPCHGETSGALKQSTVFGIQSVFMETSVRRIFS